MGSCLSVSEEEKKNREIEKQMKRDRRADESLIKLLLLGTGESGKSTLFKQMKILYTEQKGFTKSERAGYVSIVHNNILFNMQQLLKGCMTHTPAENQELADKVLAMDPKATVIDANVANMLADIWADKGVQDSWLYRSSIQVQDALEYYMGRINEIGNTEYSPDNQDILRTRVRTSGIVEENFEINGTKIAMYDVGGQRNERRKWMHKFEDVSAIIYVAAISEYDQLLFEDNSTNRQDESLQLFEKVFNSEFFRHLNFILFLNKEDLFIQKLPVIPFRIKEGRERRNVDFKGPYCEPGTPSAQIGTREFQECLYAAETYIRGLYEAINNRKNPLYVHITDATNTENMNKIMTAVKDIVLRENLQRTGFIVGEDRI